MSDLSLSLFSFLLLSLLFLTFPTFIHARTDGADAAACDDHDPRGKLDSQHSGNLKTTANPFTINIASGANPNDGDPISITLSTTSGDGFKGFLISALPSSQVTLGSGYNGKRLGSWSSSSTSLVQPRCQQSGIISALTHTSASFKKTLPLIWTPPPVAAGTTLPNITILATFVANINDAYIVSTPFIITPTGPSQPSLPLNPQAIAATNTSLTISWTVPKRSGSQPITNYIIQIDSGSESADTSQQIISPPTRIIDTQNTNTNYTITGLISGYTYRIQVAAKNGVPGETLFTDLFAARVLRNTIRPPGIVTLTIPTSTLTSTSAIIIWTTPDLAGETLVSYELQRASNGDLENVKTVYKGTNLNFTDTGLIANTTYQYRIITTTLAGSTASPYTSITAKTCPNNCSGKGICAGDGRCICQNGVMGSDCSLNANTLCMGNNRMCMQWAVSTVESYVYVRLIGPSTKWFGVILDPDEIDGMKEGDAWIANIGADTSNPTVQDMYSSGRVDPNGDFRESDLEWMTSTSRNKTAIAFTFRRKLDTGDAQDRKIVNIAGTKMRLSWAIGSELNLKQHQRGDYGKAHIDWVAGTAYELDPSLKYASFYLPIIIGLGVVILTGLCLQYPSIYRSTIGRLLLRSRVPPPWIASTPMDKLTLDFRPSLLTLSYGEVGVVLTYIICVAAMIGHGYKQMIEINRDGRYIWGHVTAVHIAMTWLPMTKHSVWLFVFGISFERAIRFHRWIARMTMIMMYIHLGTMIAIWGGSIISSTDETYGGNGVVYGFVAFLVFQSIILLSIEPIRRFAYEWFLYPHMILSKVATVFAMIHSTYLRWYMLVPLILYGWDYIIRYINAFRYTSSIESLIYMSGTSPITSAPHEDKVEPGVTVLTVKVPPSFRYHGGDYVYLNIPIISPIQWHPFSISSYPTATSSSDMETLTFHILDMGTGTYTNDVAKFAASTSFQQGSLQVKIDGPYGRLMIPVYEYPHLILVAGGVGATPMISILGSLFSAYQSGRLSHLRSCDVIWISRSSHALQNWWKSLFTSIISHGMPFRLHLYCTTQDPKHRPLIHIRPSRERNETPTATATPDASAAAVAVVVTSDEDGCCSDDAGPKAAPPSPPLVPTPPDDVSAVATLPQFHDSTDIDIPVLGGRPNLPQLIREIHTSRSGQSSSAAVPMEYAGNKWGVLACGPPALITTTRQLAYQFNCDWHEETFTI